jgi:hypothetical protein
MIENPEAGDGGSVYIGTDWRRRKVNVGTRRGPDAVIYPESDVRPLPRSEGTKWPGPERHIAPEEGPRLGRRGD